MTSEQEAEREQRYSESKRQKEEVDGLRVENEELKDTL